MDPNANIRAQEEILQLFEAQGSWMDLESERERLYDLRDEMFMWRVKGGFDPDWSSCPLAREYYGK